MKSKGKITQGTKIHMCSEYLEKFKFQNQKCPKFIQSTCLQWQSCETVLMGYINTQAINAKKKKDPVNAKQAKGQAGGQETGKPKADFADIEISDTLHLEQ